MSDSCKKCGEPLPEEWIFCARCGARVELAAPPQAAEHEPAPVTGAFGGAAFGLIAAPIMLIVGIMVCLTGWGIFIGIPIILGAILAPLAGPLFGLGAAKRKVL